MRVGVAAMLALVLGAFAAHFALADRGYVLVSFRGYVVEMSVPGLVLVVVAGYLLVRGLAALAHAPRRWRTARATRTARRSSRELAEGFRHLVEGHWARSERLLTRDLRHADAPFMHQLLAARAAQLQGATERRDEWLKLARSASAEGAASALLTQAELTLEAGDAAAALTALQELEREHGEQPAAIALLARTYRALGDQAGLFALLPRLPRAALPGEERDALTELALKSELDNPALTAERLKTLWTTLSDEQRAAPGLLAARAGALQRLGQGAEAERELKAALKRGWHTALVASYGEVRGADLGKQLKQAENWLKAHADDAVLLRTTGQLCMASELWGKARSYFEASVALAPVPETYAWYGRLLLAIGDAEGALDAFRAGLALVSPSASEPPPAVRRPGLGAREADIKALG